MISSRNEDYLRSVVNELRKLPKEIEWLEFKRNKADSEEIGEYISSLSNSAALLGKVNAYMIWGIDNNSHEIIGTSFKPYNFKIGNEELENWLLRLMTPKINFQFFSFVINEKNIVMLEIQAAFRHPVRFKGAEYIRIGSYKKRLKDYPEKERELWRIFDQIPFEREIALENADAEDVLKLLDYPSYFDLLEISLPENRNGILSALEADEMIVSKLGGKWDITNLGAVLFAKNLGDFRHLKRKAVRVIQYKGKSKVETSREQEGVKGYAAGYEGLIDFISSQLPRNEEIGKVFRKEVPMFPDIAIRELVANAIIHQDFHITGTGPVVEIYSDRMEIINPGLPLIDLDRFIDSPPKSRNEALASFMRRIGICEERGSGIDKVVFQTEFYQLPAPIFEISEEHMISVLFSHREFKEMDKVDRIRACYQHACLRYVQRDFMTNTTLRQRFGIEEKNRAMVSRIISDTISASLIVCYDDSVGTRAKKYQPVWV